MTAQELKKKYLDFFVAKGHKLISSASLVPENDSTTLFTSSGMQPLVPYLKGEPHPEGKRLVNSQPSLRLEDINEIGDNRHTTFFEMLGNWSLGDYFKKEQLAWIWEFLIKKLGLPKEKLYVTVFSGDKNILKDKESATIWQSLGIPKKRIFSYGVEKNWWSRSGIPKKMPVGEIGGPDSEIFFDFGTQHNPQYGKECHPNCDCGRFLEIGNSVFIQYQKNEGGTFTELPQKNVDFGGGLERLVAATNNNPDIFQIDLFQEVIKQINKVSGKEYKIEENKSSMRIIADHLRAATFLIANKVEPSNKTQGYVVRRLLRRAAVKMRLLTGQPTTEDQFIPLIEGIINSYRDTDYFTIVNKEDIKNKIGVEILRFTKSLDEGLKIIQKTNEINSQIAFNLYQTYGFPLELTEEIAREKGQKIDKNIFREEFRKHQELSRTASAGMFKGGLADHSETVIKLHTVAHLLHQALRQILGSHIGQVGSNITPERLRFDFTHPEKLTAQQIQQVEDLVNEKIKENLPVKMETMTLTEAKKKGALAFFTQKYGSQVKVYSIGAFSKEVCGGPHVVSTGKIGGVKIIKEKPVGAGRRRVYVVLAHGS